MVYRSVVILKQIKEKCAVPGRMSRLHREFLIEELEPFCSIVNRLRIYTRRILDTQVIRNTV